jgi:O-antigen ligase
MRLLKFDSSPQSPRTGNDQGLSMRLDVPHACYERVESPLAQAGSYEVNPFLRWAFYAFVFSLTFETVNLGIPLEVTSVFGGLLLLSTALQPSLFLRLPSKAFWCFFAYLYICAILAVMSGPQYRAGVIWNLFVLTQLMILGWISYNLMKHDHVANTALLVLVASCATLAILQLAGVTDVTRDASSSAERVTAMGFHPNDIARILALGVLALIGLTYGQRKSALRFRLFAWPIFALIGITIVRTGSRGGLLALGVGLLAFVLRGGTFWSKLRNALVVMLGIGFFVLVSYQVDVTRERFEQTLDAGDLARRDQIYATAVQMIQERPLLGWGPVAGDFEMGARLAHGDEYSKNAHNLIFYLLISTGLAGTIPMLVGTGLSLLAAWKARNGTQGVLPFAMLSTVLVANMSGLWLFNKLHWMILAYALASGSRVLVTGYQRSIAQPLIPTTDVPAAAR